MDWVTLTRDDVDNDRLPRLCVYCGKPSRDMVNRTFEWYPEWVSPWLLVGLVPGLILQAMYKRTMRVSLPVCAQHAALPLKIGLVAGIGWLFVMALFGGVGAAIAAAVSTMIHATGVEWSDLLLGLIPGAVVGFLIWLVWVVRLSSQQIVAKEINYTGIYLEGVAHNFVMAVKAQGTERGQVAPSINPNDLNLQTVSDSPTRPAV